MKQQHDLLRESIAVEGAVVPCKMDPVTVRKVASFPIYVGSFMPADGLQYIRAKDPNAVAGKYTYAMTATSCREDRPMSCFLVAALRRVIDLHFWIEKVITGYRR